MSCKIICSKWNAFSKATKHRLLKMTLPTGTMANFAKATKPITFVAYEDRKRAGWLVYDKKSAIAMVYVDPTFRRKGIGKSLLDAACFTTNMYSWSPPRVKSWTHSSSKLFAKYRKSKLVKNYDFAEVQQYKRS
jgi:GNAT superfamily N-acetyltransferase